MIHLPLTSGKKPKHLYMSNISKNTIYLKIIKKLNEVKNGAIRSAKQDIRYTRNI